MLIPPQALLIPFKSNLFPIFNQLSGNLLLLSQVKLMYGSSKGIKIKHKVAQRKNLQSYALLLPLIAFQMTQPQLRKGWKLMVFFKLTFSMLTLNI